MIAKPVCHAGGVFAYAPLSELNTDASGLTPEMKFIIALNGSLVELRSSCLGELSLGSLLVSAHRTKFKARDLGRPGPAAPRAATAGETETDRAAELNIAY